MPGFVPPPHPAPTSQGNAGQQFRSMAGLFWPQGDPGQLRQAARAWREVERALQEVEGASQSSANQIRAYNQGPAIEAFAGYWRKWQGAGGYFQLSAQASGQLADALERYAGAIEQARQKVMEIAATAATVLAIGLVLTIFTAGISDAAAAGAAAGLTAAAAAVGVELSATVATIAGTILAGAAIGAVASMTIDTAIQIEHIEVFHDQKGFDWTEFEHSMEIGVLTGGAGAGVGMAAKALTPVATEAWPLLGRGASAFERLPAWAQSGTRGTLLGGGMAAGVDELTTGQVNPLDVALGATSGGLGDMIGTRGASRLAAGKGLSDAEAIAILRNAAAGKGNFGIGSATASEAEALGRAWVGENYRVASDGKTLISADGLHQYRPPSYKPSLGMTQANFESRWQPSGQWQSNGHLDISDR